MGFAYKNQTYQGGKLHAKNKRPNEEEIREKRKYAGGSGHNGDCGRGPKVPIKRPGQCFGSGLNLPASERQGVRQKTQNTRGKEKEKAPKINLKIGKKKISPPKTNEGNSFYKSGH